MSDHFSGESFCEVWAGWYAKGVVEGGEEEEEEGCGCREVGDGGGVLDEGGEEEGEEEEGGEGAGVVDIENCFHFFFFFWSVCVCVCVDWFSFVDVNVFSKNKRCLSFSFDLVLK